MSESQRIGHAIRDLRRHAGVTQEELARRTDRSVDAISQIERGINSPNVDTVLRIASALNVSAAAFFMHVDEMDSARQENMMLAVAELKSLDERDLAIAVRQLQAFNG